MQSRLNASPSTIYIGQHDTSTQLSDRVGNHQQYIAPIVIMHKLKRQKESTDTTTKKQRKVATTVKPYTGRMTRSMTRGVYVRKASSSQHAGHGASKRQTQEHVAEMLGLSKDIESDVSIASKVYVKEVSQPADSSASKHQTQKCIGEMLGLFKIVDRPTERILDKQQATLIATSLQHDSIVDDKPITSQEKTRLLQLVYEDHLNPPVIECQCKVHICLSSIEPSFATQLRSIISFAAELGGEMKGGNLTNCGVELLKVIFSLAGKTDILVCPEGTSTAAHAGSKVVYEMGIKEKTICVEATPDFYARTCNEYVYLLIGECQSSGSKYPTVQLAIATLGQFASERFKHPAKKLAACLFTKAKTASVFLGEELGRKGEKIFVSFSKVNRECAFNLTSEDDITEFADTVIGVTKLVSKPSDATS